MTSYYKARVRNEAISQATGSYTLGVETRENWDNVNKMWVFGAAYDRTGYIRPYYRDNQSLETCSDYVNWPGPPYTSGGNLDLIKGHENGRIGRPLRHDGWAMLNPSDWVRFKYEGNMSPNWYPPYPYYLKERNVPKWDLADLSSYGPQAYQLYSPVKPKVDLGQFFAEFKETPKMLFDSAKFFSGKWLRSGGHPRKFYPKALANEWLNYNFGWVPFVSTLLDFHSVMSNLHKHVRRIQEKNGNFERRGGPVEEELVSEEVYLQTSSGNLLTNPTINSAFRTSGTTTIYKRKYRQVWFNGYFMYYIPKLLFRKSWWQPEIFRMILGLNISPSLLYELTPFSWLFDWFGNLGDILANAADEDLYKLVSRNSFLMSHSQERFDFVTNRICNGFSNPGTWTWSYDRKQRTKASPYGFGVSSSGLSLWQSSILASLGLSFRS